MFDLIIVGGGPAGLAAAVYAARKKLRTVIIADQFGGQSLVSEKIENWLGTPTISGAELAETMKKHLTAYAGETVAVKEGRRVGKITEQNGLFTVETEGGDKLETKALLITTGSSRRKLTVPGAAKFENKGISYCASCDGPLFTNQDVAVIGGGNAGFETAAQLLAYCRSVTLIHKNAEFKADPIIVEKTLANPKFTGLLNAELLEIKGDKFVSGLVYKNKTTGEIKDLPVTGIFAEIGHQPATDFIKDLVKTNDFGAIVINPASGQTSRPGIWAAGDCTDTLYHQNNIAAGDGVKALEDIYLWLHKNK